MFFSSEGEMVREERLHLSLTLTEHFLLQRRGRGFERGFLPHKNFFVGTPYLPLQPSPTE
jgi:hypothetical protein